MGKGKVRDPERRENRTETRLANANKKLEDYDPEWKAKGRSGQGRRRRAGAGRAAQLCPEGAGCRAEILERKRQRAFMADLEAQKLPIQDGKGAGL